jgi:hypothetical protein
VPHTVRKLVLLLAATAFVPFSLLFAASGDEAVFTIGVLPIGEGDLAYRDMVIDAGSTYCPRFGDDAGAFGSYLMEKEMLETQAEQESKVHQAYVDEDLEALEEARQETATVLQDTVGVHSIVYQSLDRNPALSPVIEAGTEGMEWYCGNAGLDGLLAVSSEPMDRFDRLVVRFFSMATKEETILLDRLVLEQEPERTELQLAVSMLAAFGYGDLVPVKLEGMPGGLSVTSDGESLAISRSRLFLSPGVHLLALSAFGYGDKTVSVTVPEDGTATVDASLDPVLYEGLALSSLSGNVAWYVDGEAMGTSTGLYLDSYSLPFSVLATKDGFLPQAVLSTQEVSEIVFDLQPSWMEDKTLSRTTQKDFYAGLRQSIFMFGLYVACTTLSVTNGLESQLWQPLLVTTSGLALVASITTIKNLASYASMAAR